MTIPSKILRSGNAEVKLQLHISLQNSSFKALQGILYQLESYDKGRYWHSKLHPHKSADLLLKMFWTEFDEIKEVVKDFRIASDIFKRPSQ